MRCREPGKRLEIVKFVVTMRGADGCPPDGASVGAREQLVFGAERDSPFHECQRCPLHSRDHRSSNRNN
jgi:hypothetical protein